MLGRKILNILSGDKESNKKTYIKYKYLHLFAKYSHSFLVVDFCIPVFYALKMVVFVPPKCPRDIKGTKNKPLECLGNKRGTKLIFYSFVNYK